MEEISPKEHHDEIFSKAVKAGKRTYFFDVKETANDVRYITITESKRRFDTQKGSYIYEKHKIFLYKENFEQFANGLSDVIDFIETGQEPIYKDDNSFDEQEVSLNFEDLSIKS